MQVNYWPINNKISQIIYDHNNKIIKVLAEYKLAEGLAIAD